MRKIVLKRFSSKNSFFFLLLLNMTGFVSSSLCRFPVCGRDAINDIWLQMISIISKHLLFQFTERLVSFENKAGFLCSKGELFMALRSTQTVLCSSCKHANSLSRCPLGAQTPKQFQLCSQTSLKNDVYWKCPTVLHRDHEFYSNNSRWVGSGCKNNIYISTFINDQLQPFIVNKCIMK